MAARWSRLSVSTVVNVIMVRQKRPEGGIHGDIEYIPIAESGDVGEPFARISEGLEKLGFTFNAQRPTDWDSAAKSDTARFSKYFWGLLDRSIYMPCSQFEALFVSAAHTEADIDATIAAAREALQRC